MIDQFKEPSLIGDTPWKVQKNIRLNHQEALSKVIIIKPLILAIITSLQICQLLKLVIIMMQIFFKDQTVVLDLIALMECLIRENKVLFQV